MDPAPPLWILFSGRRCSGKDTAADELQRMIGGVRASFAGLLKEDAARKHHLDLDRLFTDRKYKEEHRETLIEHGRVEREADPDCWVRRTFEKYAQCKLVLVSDYRFPNEAEWLKKQGARVVSIYMTATEHVRVARGWKYCPEIDDDASECSLESQLDRFTYLMPNNGDMDGLRTSLRLCVENMRHRGIMSAK